MSESTPSDETATPATPATPAADLEDRGPPPKDREGIMKYLDRRARYQVGLFNNRQYETLLNRTRIAPGFTAHVDGPPHPVNWRNLLNLQFEFVRGKPNYRMEVSNVTVDVNMEKMRATVYLMLEIYGWGEAVSGENITVDEYVYSEEEDDWLWRRHSAIRSPVALGRDDAL